MQDQAVFERAVAAHGATPGALIAILQEIQERLNYLPRACFPYLARALGVGEAAIYSVATFYENFSLEPKGKHVLRVCDGTACHVRGSNPILERLLRDLGLAEAQKTTPDALFTVETVSCLGACGLAPVMTVDGRVYPAMTPDKASKLIQTLKEGAAHAEEQE